MTTRVAAGIFVVLFMAACRLPGSPPTSNAMIDWVIFVQVGSTHYVAGPQSPTVLKETDLGPVYAKVKFKVSGNVCDPNYRLKDGDAAVLDPGSIRSTATHPASNWQPATTTRSFSTMPCRHGK